VSADLAPVWLTVKQAAERVQCGEKVIYRAVKSGQLRAARIGGRRNLRFAPEWVDDWMVSSSQPVNVRQWKGRVAS
jgi:excisionase family DNA binding protein